MPPSSALSTPRRLDRLLKRSFDRLLLSPSCERFQARARREAASTTTSQCRHASTLTSSTAINGTKAIPLRYQPLHIALIDVGKNASAQVNLSRLQLALQGLESESPPTRVAVLGLNVADTVRRIIRLLLADPLDPEGTWEKQLSEGTDGYNDGLLIRYGHSPNSSLPQPRSSVPTLYIPSSVLQRNNVEILVSTISADSPDVTSSTPTPSDTLLSPVIGTPTSASGRQVLINQPVHQTLLVANGLDELITISQILANTKFTSTLDKSMISVAVELPDTAVPTNSKTTIIDTNRAAEGLTAIRSSLSLASTYEQKWNSSGLPALTGWLRSATSPASKMSLISSLLTSTSANLDAQKLISAVGASSQSISNATRSSLEQAITSFSSLAHTELQSGLAAAWSSRNWRKLAWWKLFWRVDDVGLIISDLVTNAWLPNTEKAVYELSGRLRQVGIEPVEEAIPVEVAVVNGQPRPDAAPTPPKWEAGGTTIPPEVPVPSDRRVHSQPYTPTAPPAHLIPMTSASPVRAFSSDARPVLTTSPDGRSVQIRIQSPPQPIPLSALISSVRANCMATAIADLTVTAQQLVLRTLSISGLSAGLSGLLYVSTTAGVYEAGTVVAAGTAFALWRMQGDWMRGCRGLERGLLSEGRGVIRRVEGRMRELVDTGGMVEVDKVEERLRSRAEEAVRRARVELEVLSEGGGDTSESGVKESDVK